MTAEGASSQGGRVEGPAVASRVRQLSSRTSLRTKLITALLALVAIALAVDEFRQHRGVRRLPAEPG